MVDCPNRKGIQSAAFMLSVSLSGPRGLDLLAPIPWVVQASGVWLSSTEKVQCVLMECPQGQREEKRGWGQLGRWIISFSRKENKGGKKSRHKSVLELMLKTLEVQSGPGIIQKGPRDWLPPIHYFLGWTILAFLFLLVFKKRTR